MKTKWKICLRKRTKASTSGLPLTLVMALRLANKFGSGPEVWKNLQRTYDMIIARQGLDDAPDKILELRRLEVGDCYD